MSGYVKTEFAQRGWLVDFAASQADNGNVQPDSPWVRGILHIPYQQISAFFDDLQTRRRSQHLF
ncbi:MAG TPA: hypothetical protein PLD03_08880, partial [Thiomonas arsenitoxydans]|nr:hypothetical protein [Thiomonas arsenitoxydans]